MNDKIRRAHRNALLVAEATGEVWLLGDLADPIERRTPVAEPYLFRYDS